MSLSASELTEIITVLQQGGVIAYPTEAIYGLGCDPFNEEAVRKIFDLKQRPLEKGLIIIASDFSQLENLIVPSEHMEYIQKSWPGPNTWVFSASLKTPTLLSGKFESIRVRVTDHPIANAICAAFGKPIVSTSANLSGETPAACWQDMTPQLLNKLDYLVKGKVGTQSKCSTIRDARNLQIIRD